MEFLKHRQRQGDWENPPGGLRCKTAPKGKVALLEFQRSLCVALKMSADTDLGTDIATSIKALFILGTHGHKKLQDAACSALATSAAAASYGFILSQKDHASLPK